MTDFQQYQSPFTWRYSSPEMREIWSEQHQREIWRDIWVALAEVQSGYGLVAPAQVDELNRHRRDIQLERSLEIEAEIKHDLMAEIIVFGEQCPGAEGIIHLGATSMDIKDNAVVIQTRESLDLLLEKLKQLVLDFCRRIEEYAHLPVIGFTHLQPAEPTTLGYRLANYTQDLLESYRELSEFRNNLRGKGFTGAVGSSASFQNLLGEENLVEFQNQMSQKLGLSFFPIVNQTYPRRQDYKLLSALAGMTAPLYRFAFDLRILQSPPLAELAEPFGDQQVGSSAMPFKRNPIQAEKITSLARYAAQLPRTAWDNAAHCLLERTLDDSANRRTILPEGFLAADELISVTRQIVQGLHVFELGIQKNLQAYRPFAASEPILMALSKAGASRQEMHQVLQDHARKAWSAVQSGEDNPLEDLFCSDAKILQYLTEQEIKALMKLDHYLGDAPRRAEKFAAAALKYLE